MAFSIMQEVGLEYSGNYLEKYKNCTKEEVIDFLYSISLIERQQLIVTEWDKKNKGRYQQQRADEWLEDNQ